MWVRSGVILVVPLLEDADASEPEDDAEPPLAFSSMGERALEAGVTKVTAGVA